MSPTIVGLLLAIPLSWLSGQLARRPCAEAPRAAADAGGSATRRRSRRAPTRCRRRTRGSASTTPTGFSRSIADPDLRERTSDAAAARAPRRRGEIEPERALAEAKLVDAETIEDALDLAEAQGAHGRAARPRAGGPAGLAAAGEGLDEASSSASDDAGDRNQTVGPYCPCDGPQAQRLASDNSVHRATVLAPGHFAIDSGRRAHCIQDGVVPGQAASAEQGRDPCW